MNRESQQSWWRELGAISRGLDFLQGGGSFDSSESKAAQVAEAHTSPARHSLAHLLHDLVYLGGRPMHAGHNDDLDESFEASSRIDGACRTC